MSAGPLPDYPMWQGAIVRHADLDPNDHVTNSVICSWFDDGRYVLLRRHLRPVVKPSDYFALVMLEMHFLQEVRMFDEPRVGTAITRIGRSSIAMQQHLLVGERIAATATSVTVLSDGVARRARPLDEAHRRALAPFVLAEAS